MLRGRWSFCRFRNRCSLYSDVKVFSNAFIYRFSFLLINIRCTDATSTCIYEFVSLVKHLFESSAGRIVGFVAMFTCNNNCFNGFIITTTYFIHRNRCRANKRDESEQWVKMSNEGVPAIENEKARKMIESTNMLSNSQKYRCKRPRECIELEKWTEIVQEGVEIGLSAL